MSKRAITLGVLVAAYGFVVRPRMLRSGVTDGELNGPFPGKDLIPGSHRTSTMATTIDAPRSQVWRWLVQMGHERAGWYSWDRLDNGGDPSAESIHPEWQQIAVGDRLMTLPDERAWFDVAAVDPERFLALRASLDLKGHPFDPAGIRPRTYSDSLWSFSLRDAGEGRTRLVVSCYAHGKPELLYAIPNLFFWEPAHWIMQRRQFQNLKRRCERTGAVEDRQLAATR